MKEDGPGKFMELSLGDLLSFVTGADYPPPLGFSSSPEIEFVVKHLHLSLHLTEFDTFKNAFDTALISAHGFGLV